MFKPGDKVRNKDGSSFSNHKMELTVKSVEAFRFSDKFDKVWLLETDSYTSSDVIELVPTEIDVVKEKIKKLLNQKENKIKDLQDDIKKLNYTLVTLEDLND
jgi:hypothetical protein